MIVFSKKNNKIISKNNLLIVPDYIKISKIKYLLISDISNIENIPKGAFGTVMFYKSNQENYIAVKIINLTEMEKKENGKKKVLKSRLEAQLMKKMKNEFSKLCQKFVVNYIGNIEKTFRKNTIQYIIMEKMDTDLKNFIKEQNYIKKNKVDKKTVKKNKNNIPKVNYNLKLVKNIIHQILSALKCLHDHNIVYNDLKLSNILWNYKTKKIKLTDFNCILTKTVPNLTGCSTITYRSPEQINHESDNNNYKTDIWSVGVIMISLLTKKNSSYFNRNDRIETKSSIVTFDPSVIPDIVSFSMKNFNNFSKKEYQNIVDFLTNVLQPELKKRWNVNKCLKHKIFTS